MEWCFQRQLSRHPSLLHLYRHVMHMYRSGEGILGAKISTKSLKRRTRQEAKARAPQDEMGKRNRADRHKGTCGADAPTFPGHRELSHARANRQHESRCKYAI